jgi:predicted ATPase with chaperone activity
MADFATDLTQGPLVVPHRIEQMGIRRGLYEDLALKVLYLNGEMSLIELSDHMCVSIGVIEEIFQFFRKERFVEVKGMSGGTHRIVATSEGRQRAADLLSLNQYTGPAPVSLGDYVAQIKNQSVKGTAVRPEQLHHAFSQMVIGDEMLLRIGTAVVSGTSMFIYGPPGTGKTSIAARISAIYQDYVWIPHAVEVDNQIITVYDPGVHKRRMEKEIEDCDRRWVLCHRPCVVTGGELTAEMLELQFNPVSRYYSAPLQMKANNGVFVLDDFGRQRIRPHELLNRWMTALDRRIEFLALPGGRKFEIPFDTLVVFSTNIEPAQLADEAFLRRIPNKIRAGWATREQFKQIFRREAEEVRSLHVDEGDLDYLVDHLTNELKVPLTQCYARDLLDQIFWAARYLHAKPEFNKDLATWACSNYFLQASNSDARKHSAGQDKS